MEPVTNKEHTSRQDSRKRCSNCGASNKQDAQWCGQCLEKFEEPLDVQHGEDLDEEDAARLLSSLADDTLTSLKVVERPASETPEQDANVEAQPKAGTAARPASDETTGAFQVGEEGITWTCLKCESVNAMEERACTVCGTNFAEAIQPAKAEEELKDPNKAAMASLALPGAGHAYLGMWPEAVARAVISIWVVGVFIFSAAQDAGQARIMSLLFGFVAFGLWVTAAHDAYREATGMSKAVILKRKFFLHLVMGLLVLSIAMIFATAVSAGR